MSGLEIDAGDQNLAQVSKWAWRAIQMANETPYLFRYGRMLCRVEQDETGTCILQQLTQDRLRYELARVAKWYKTTKTGDTAAKPPGDVVTDMLATPNAPLPK